MGYNEIKWEYHVVLWGIIGLYWGCHGNTRGYNGGICIRVWKGDIIRIHNDKGIMGGDRDIMG